MDAFAFNHRRSVHHRFRQRRVRVNRLHDAHGISLKLSCQPVLRDHLRGFHTNDMRTQNLAVLFAGNQLDEACHLTDRRSLAASLKGELADFSPCSLQARSVRPTLATCGWQ